MAANDFATAAQSLLDKIKEGERIQSDGADATGNTSLPIMKDIPHHVKATEWDVSKAS